MATRKPTKRTRLLTAAESASKGGEARAKSLSKKQRSAIAKMGASARSKSLTKEKRTEIAKKAIAARWKRRDDQGATE